MHGTTNIKFSLKVDSDTAKPSACFLQFLDVGEHFHKFGREF